MQTAKNLGKMLSQQKTRNADGSHDLSLFLRNWELGPLPLEGEWKLPGWSASHDGEWFG